MKQSLQYGLIICWSIAWSSIAQTNVAPYIISEPQDQAVNPCDSATFKVVAGGSEPLSYQWEVGGYLTGWTTNSSFTEGWVAWAYNGRHYSVTITNSAGSVTSRQALLTVPIVPCVDRPAGYYWPVMGYLASVWPPTNWVCSFAGLPNGSMVLKADPDGTGPNPFNGFAGYYRLGFTGWLPHIPSPPPAGFGWLVYLSSPAMLCFPTNPPTPVLPLDLPPGFSLVCSQYPREATFEDIVGRSPDPGSHIYRSLGGWPLYPTNIEGTTFITYSFTNGTWNPSNPIVPLGEAVWVLQPPKIFNPRFVSGSFQFETRTATFASLDVEYTDVLDSTSPWLLLTNLVGSGNVTNVVDAIPTNSLAQRYYRLKLKPMPWQ